LRVRPRTAVIFERFERQTQEHQGKPWQNPPSSWQGMRKTARCGTWSPADVADTKSTFLVSGNGDVIEPMTAFAL